MDDLTLLIGLAGIMGAVGYVVGRAMEDRDWKERNRIQLVVFRGRIENLQNEVASLEIRARKYRETMLRACERAAAFRVELDRLRAGKDGT